MEKKYNQSNLPKPNDERIRIKNIDKRIMAVIKFSGRWTEKNFKKHENRLLNNLKTQNITITGEAIYARYNAPFTPWFMRRNEVMFEVNL